MKRYRNKLAPAHRDILALLSGRRPASPSPNWREILRISDENRVKPLIYDSVRSLGLDVPEEYLFPMERSYAATFAKNCEILSALDEMGRILSPYGIEAVPIKGASLIQRVYKDPGLRPLSDVDVWIDGDKARAAKRILLNVGFAKEWDGGKTVPKRYGSYVPPPFCKRLNVEIDQLIDSSHFQKHETGDLATHLPLLLLPRANGIKFEIHHRLLWNISALSPQMARDIWNRRKPVAGKEGLALVSEKDELIILAAHLLCHKSSPKFFSPLMHHMDIALAWQKEAWRRGIENTDNREVKELVDLSVAALLPSDEAHAGPSRGESFENLFFSGIQPGFLEKNKKLLRRLAKIWEVYGFFMLARYLWEWAFPSPGDMRQVCGNRNGSLFFYYFHRVFATIRRRK